MSEYMCGYQGTSIGLQYMCKFVNLMRPCLLTVQGIVKRYCITCLVVQYYMHCWHTSMRLLHEIDAMLLQ